MRILFSFIANSVFVYKIVKLDWWAVVAESQAEKENEILESKIGMVGDNEIKDN